MTVQASKSKWPTTRWSLVQRAAQEVDGPAMQELLRNYRAGLRLHLIAVRSIPPQDADDLLQGFMLTKMLRSQWLDQAQSSRGRFRTYLLTALDRYVVSEFRKSQASKRAPRSMVPFDNSDEQGHLLSRSALPDVASLLDLAWIRERIEETLDRTRDACRNADRYAYWLLFEDRIMNPILSGIPPQPYAAYVEELGFKSPMQASNALTTVKRMLARSFREVIAEHTQAGEDLEQELNELWTILAAFENRHPGHA